MATKHTPGPWQVVWYPSQCTAEIETVEQEPGKYRHMTNNLPMCAGINVNDIEHIVAADDPEKRDYSYSAEACANARLMAAAPELLASLTRLYMLLECSMQITSEDMEMAALAITKAEGK